MERAPGERLLGKPRQDGHQPRVGAKPSPLCFVADWPLHWPYAGISLARAPRMAPWGGPAQLVRCFTPHHTPHLLLSFFHLVDRVMVTLSLPRFLQGQNK